MKMNKKLIVATAACAALLIGSISTSLAWLVDSTGPVENVFTTSDVDIELNETKTDFKMIPGHKIDKDPKVTVKADSEKCYVFVEVTKSDSLDSYLSYSIAEGWKLVSGESNVYYQIVEDTDADQVFSVLKDDAVTVWPSVTKEMMATADTSKPTLSFKAYAIQYEINEDGATFGNTTDAENVKAAAAWAQVFDANNDGNPDA